MSGIAGIYFLDDRPLDPADLSRMLQSLAHRGPDGSDMWSRGPVGLGHRMLWTTPESLREKLPLRHARADLVITADARIDNRDELIALLGLGDRPSGDLADSELILLAYEKWGDACPARLLGDFAFAIWDGRHQTFFCARDHFGVKPFFYYRSDRVFVFASEIKGLLCLPFVPRRLNEVRVADYLVPVLEDKEITFYQGVLRLPPAHGMTVSGRGIQLRPYWALDPAREIRYRSDGEYAEAFREIFTEAVRCRLRSALPLGSMLSGGLDSSSIVCVARQLLRERGSNPLKTVSLIFDDVPQCDERPFINAVLAGGGLEPHYVHGDRVSPLADLARIFHHEDEAFYAPNLFLHWALYREANKQGVRVLLDGLDGDTTVSHGVGYLAELVRTGRWMRAAEEVGGLSRHFEASRWRVLWGHGLAPQAPASLRTAWRILRGRNQPLWKTNSITNDPFAERVGLGPRMEHMLGERAKPSRTSKDDHWRQLTSGLVSFAFGVADRAAAAFTLETRYPFFDKRLAEFCLALPGDQKLSKGWTRMVMRRAMANILPVAVQWRRGKADLGLLLHRGLLTFERDFLEGMALHGTDIVASYVDMPAFREAYRRYNDRGTDDSLQVWRVVTLASWLSHEQSRHFARAEDRMKLDDAIKKSETDGERAQKAREEKQRKAYRAPRLRIHGTAQELTTSVGTKGHDGLTGTRVI
jgi:asparagine synthase (glutamine-hydrolysing)